MKQLQNEYFARQRVKLIMLPVFPLWIRAKLVKWDPSERDTKGPLMFIAPIEMNWIKAS